MLLKRALLIAIILGCLPAFAQHVKAQVGNHGISLTWQESTQGTTFNIYRGTAPGGENYATPYASVGVGILGYTDRVGTPGTTYYYTVTALASGLESDPSNEASAVFPTVPAAPSGLSAKSQ